MGIYSRLLRSIGDKQWFASVASRLAPALDRATFRVSGGRRLATPREVPTLFLTTAGRTTGLERRVAVSYLMDGASYIVVGTNWGKPTTPEWALNLKAEPHALVEVPGQSSAPVAATPIESADQDPWWERFSAMWPPYAAYRRRAAGRLIQMFRLDPAPR